MRSLPRGTVAFSALAALGLCGCAADSYGGARLLDLTDIVDVRVGTGLGLGVQVDATMLLGTGVGGSSVDWSRAWFGRHAVDVEGTTFVGLLVVSGFGCKYADDDPAREWWQVFGFNRAAKGLHRWSGCEGWFAESRCGPPVIDIFRFGGTVFLPGVHGGLYLNVGEIGDLLLGVFMLDPANDDGEPKWPVESESSQAGST
jgi:hypothetical protein